MGINLPPIEKLLLHVFIQINYNTLHTRLLVLDSCQRGGAAYACRTNRLARGGWLLGTDGVVRM